MGAGQIRGCHNPADGLTKLKHNGVLDKVLRTEHMVKKADK